MIGLAVPDPDESGQAVPEHEASAGLLDVELDHVGRVRTPSRGGRPTKFTTRRVVAILSALWEGSNRAEAARKAGVSPAAFYAWLNLGRRGHPTFAPLAEAVATIELHRGLRGVLGALSKRPGFWKALP